MNLRSILSPERTVRNAEASSKKKAIELAAEIIAGVETDLEAGNIYRGLIEREKLGTTALGHGVAIPHCRLESCHEMTGALFVFDQPVDFAAYDDEPVSIMFVLLVPQEETSAHLTALAMLAERFEQPDYRRSLRNTSSDTALFEAALGEDDTGS